MRRGKSENGSKATHEGADPQRTRADWVERLIDRHVADRNMDPQSIADHYQMTHVGIEIDPHFFEARLRMGWGFFRDEPRFLDHITRNMAISVFLAFRGRPGCYHQGKKAVMMGATYEQMMEAYEAGHVAGGGPVLMNGISALKRMMDEGIQPGEQEGEWTHHWIDFGSTESESAFATRPTGSLEDRIRSYYSDDCGGKETADDLVFGSQMDPAFFDGLARLAWEVYAEKPCHLDPVRREMMAMIILAFENRRDELEFHIRRALRMGANVQQILELFEAAFVGAGSAPLYAGLRVLRLLHESGDETLIDPREPE